MRSAAPPRRRTVRVLHPDGAHNIAVGADAPFDIDVLGNAGYYVAGMNKLAKVTVHGNAGTGAAENMMSGEVRIKGFASTAPVPRRMAGCWSSKAMPRCAVASR